MNFLNLIKVFHYIFTLLKLGYPQKIISIYHSFKDNMQAKESIEKHFQWRLIMNQDCVIAPMFFSIFFGIFHLWNTSHGSKAKF